METPKSMDEKQRASKMGKVSSVAMREAIKYGVGAAVLTGGLTALATLKNKKFAQLMSLSAKTSLPVMSGLGVFAYKYETVQNDAINNPERWGLEEEIKESAKKGKISAMPIHHRALNYLYDHPFYFVAGVSFPFAAYILKEQLKVKHLTLSQKIMHSRVFAQGGVLVILLSTMAFTAYMDKYGRFPEPEEEQPAGEVVDYSAGAAGSGHRKRNP